MSNNIEIIFIMDASGSMFNIRNDAIGGFNSFIKEQQAFAMKDYYDTKVLMTTVFFNTFYNIISNGINILEVKPIDEKTYNPSGCTALYDAIGKGIEDVSTRIERCRIDEIPNKVIAVIMTDGEENSSKKYSKSVIKWIIEHYEKMHNWKFIYLGANQDAFAESQGIGITTYSNYSTNVNSEGVAKGLHNTYCAMSASIDNYIRTDSLVIDKNIGED